MKLTDYTFRGLGATDKEAIYQLLSTCFGSSNPGLHWRYELSGFLDSMIAYGAFNTDGMLVSFYTNVPYQLYVKHQKATVYLCLDMATHPSHRRKGLISLLQKKVYDDLKARDYWFSIGFSNQEGIKVDRNARDYGYQIVGEFCTYLAPSFSRSKSSLLIQPSKQFWAPQWSFKGSQLFKDVHYLDWRYRQKTTKNNQVLEVITGDQNLAQLVISVSANKIHLIDILPAREIDYEQLFHSLRVWARAQGKSLVSVRVLDNIFWRKIMRQARFTRSPYSHNRYFLTLRPSSNQAVSKEFFDPNQWLLFAGDIL